MEVADENATDEDLEDAKEFVREFWMCFATDTSEVSPASGFEYTIQLAENKVINEKPSRLNAEKRETLIREVKKLVEAGVLERSTSPFNYR